MDEKRDPKRLRVIQVDKATYAAFAIKTLHPRYHKKSIALKYANTLELLVAVILSAQCTDERVNKVTPALFARCKTAKDYATISQKELEVLVHSTGFYRNKSKNIIGAGKTLVRDFGGKVPSTMEELLTLPGVARKTANVMLSFAFNKDEGIIVDTHIKRVAWRLGLTDTLVPEKVERDLMAILPLKYWRTVGNEFIWHGRQLCKAQKPLCSDCPLRKTCPSSRASS